jgi:hypothetical protein
LFTFVHVKKISGEFPSMPCVSFVVKKVCHEPEKMSALPEDQRLMPENEPENCLKISASFSPPQNRSIIEPKPARNRTGLQINNPQRTKNELKPDQKRTGTEPKVEKPPQAPANPHAVGPVIPKSPEPTKPPAQIYSQILENLQDRFASFAPLLSRPSQHSVIWPFVAPLFSICQIFIDRSFPALITSAPDETVEQAGCTGTRRIVTRPAALFNLLAGRPPFPNGTRVFDFCGHGLIRSANGRRASEHQTK